MNETRQEIERAVIGIVAMGLGYEDLHPGLVAVKLGVKSEWFEDDSYAALFHVVSRRVGNGTIKDVDAFALGQEAKDLEQDKSYKRSIGGFQQANWAKIITEITEASPNRNHLNWYVDRLRLLVSQKNVLRACNSAMRGWEADPSGAIARVTESLSKAALTLQGDDSKNMIAECVGELEAREEKAWHMRVDPEGPQDLDYIDGDHLLYAPLTRLYLGLSPRFHVIAARPSVGKTMFAVNLVRYFIDHGRKVLINSLDMPSEDMVDRMRTEKSRVSLAKKRYTPTLTDLAELKKASEWVRASKARVIESLYVEDFCLGVQLLHAAGELDIVVIDYLQLMHSHNVDNSNEYERVSYVAEYLKRTANRLKIPIICLSQLNRKGAKQDGEEPTLTDLRGSGAIEQAASTILFLHRDQYVVDKWRDNPPYWFYENHEYGKKFAADNIDAIWLILAKNQNGPTGRLPIVVNKPYFCAKLGDFNAKPLEVTLGQGATLRAVKDWTSAFARVHSDWRDDTWEKQINVRNILPYMPENGDQRILLPEPKI